MKVDVYIDTNSEIVSVRSRETDSYGRVVAKRPKVHISDAEFVIQEGGQETCREEGVKNVHALVRGEWDESEKVIFGEKVVYNPFEYDEFVHAETEEPVDSADVAMVSKAGHVSAKGLCYKEQES